MPRRALFWLLSRCPPRLLKAASPGTGAPHHLRCGVPYCDRHHSKFHKNKKKPREDRAHEHKKQKLAKFEPVTGSAGGDLARTPAQCSGAADDGVTLGADVKGRGDGLGKNKVVFASGNFRLPA